MRNSHIRRCLNDLILITSFISYLGICFVISQIANPPAAFAFSLAASPKVSRNARELIGPRLCALAVPIEATWICRPQALAEPSGLGKTHFIGVQRVSIGMGFYFLYHERCAVVA